MKMKFCTALLTAATLLAPLSLLAEQAQDAAAKRRAIETYGKLPLSFEPGESAAHFLARSGNYTVSVGEHESSVAVTDAKSGKHQTLHFAFDNANPAVPLEAMEPQPGVTNYYLGKNASQVAAWGQELRQASCAECLSRRGRCLLRRPSPAGIRLCGRAQGRPFCDRALVLRNGQVVQGCRRRPGCRARRPARRFAKPYAYQKVGRRLQARGGGL